MIEVCHLLPSSIRIVCCFKEVTGITSLGAVKKFMRNFITFDENKIR